MQGYKLQRPNKALWRTRTYVTQKHYFTSNLLDLIRQPHACLHLYLR
nr:MAG TPA: hypothetical protein [Caudoviricetes sp.]